MSTGERVAIARAVPTGGGLREQPLEDHLLGVARRTEAFCRPFGASDLGYLAGLWHDLGKYAPQWQRYLRQRVGAQAGPTNAHVDEGSRSGYKVDHATAGGLHAIDVLGGIGHVLAQTIVAHHSGLHDADDFVHRIQRPGKADLLAEARAAAVSTDVLRPAHAAAPRPLPAAFSPDAPGGYALALRMLFSALVDADRLDSEAFGSPASTDLRESFAPIETLAADLDTHLARFVIDTPVNRVRTDVLADCRNAALSEPGLFTLTVPTGGGKTLSSLAFALAHARRHGLKRVIYVIPYTSIIEQTADVFRDISPAFASSVVEHHSNVDEDENGNAAESERSRFATENWYAPIVVTTNVQFFESLFTAKTSRARKLHNVCESVVILDEAQTFPPTFLKPIVGALDLLRRHYRTTIVLSTATQPALAPRRHFGSSFAGLTDVREIIGNVDRLYRELARVRVFLPNDFETASTWKEIGDRIHSEGTDVLAIVSRRADARELWSLLPRGTIHLSALMCGAHRSHAIGEIKRRLAARRGDPALPPVLVVSTQLVEAGVDLDFPVVYRAFAGLDSLAQAAGRCNREGRLHGLGKLVVFVPPKPAPSGTLRIAEAAAKTVLHGGSDDPLARASMKLYFERYYNDQDLDGRGIIKLLAPDDWGHADLHTASEKFKLIEDAESGYQSVLVPYRLNGDDELFQELTGLLRTQGPARWLMRKLQRYSVSLPPYQFEPMRDRGDLEEVIPGCFIVISDAQYRNDVGLMVTVEKHHAMYY